MKNNTYTKTINLHIPITIRRKLTTKKIHPTSLDRECDYIVNTIIYS